MLCGLRARSVIAAEFVLTEDGRNQSLAWSLGAAVNQVAVRTTIVHACAEPEVVRESLLIGCDHGHGGH